MHGGVVDILQQGGVEVFTQVATDGEAGKGDTVFLYDGGRRGEERRSLNELGVDDDHQEFLALPDGHMNHRWSYLRAFHGLRTSVVRNQIDAIVTVDPEGFDNHPDHKISFLSALRVVQRLQHDTAGAPALWSLNPRHIGAESVKVESRRKLASVAWHGGSQYTPADLDYGHEHSVLRPYEPLFYTETYDLVIPRRAGNLAVRPFLQNVRQLSYTG
jgi:LmbE family N-acetylglucosaminyl deacetylase